MLDKIEADSDDDEQNIDTSLVTPSWAGVKSICQLTRVPVKDPWA